MNRWTLGIALAGICADTVLANAPTKSICTPVSLTLRLQRAIPGCLAFGVGRPGLRALCPGNNGSPALAQLGLCPTGNG